MSQWPEWLPLREDLAHLTPYGAPQVPAEATLNTNENPYPPSPALARAIAQRIEVISETLNRYPDREAQELRDGLASYINSLSSTAFTGANIWPANGSNEVIQSLFLAFGRSSALGFTPSYSMHPLIAQVAGVAWRNGERNEDFSLNLEKAIAQIEREEAPLVFITTPNNPTGTSLSIREIELLAKAVGKYGGLLVVDEAYAEFSHEPSAVTLITHYPHIISIRTMSKAFAFAGARVGYLVAHPLVIDAMRIVRLPYHLSALTQAAALTALEFSSELLGNVENLIQARERLALELRESGLTVIPSSANFLLFGGFKQDAAELWRSLLAEGVLIRDVGLLGYLRVTIGNEAENVKFMKALRKFL